MFNSAILVNVMSNFIKRNGDLLHKEMKLAIKISASPSATAVKDEKIPMLTLAALKSIIMPHEVIPAKSSEDSDGSDDQYDLPQVKMLCKA